MTTSTSRLALLEPVGSDTVSQLRLAITNHATTLDASVVLTTGTLTARPAATAVPVGSEYFASDAGQYARSNGTSWDTYLAAGELRPTAASTAPAGWLMCDGSAVSRSTYAALYNAVGTAYGNGNGSTTFNVPDYRGRTIIGAGAGPGLTSRALGVNGGEEAHQLTVTEMPAHQHDTQGSSSSSLGGGTNVPAASNGVNDRPLTGGALSQGGGAAHNNMPPYAVANVMVKT